ncbi:hypothetical protein GY45DRAFT_1262927 [Cubamyces sp. BRFM 1775]|nr:hypothetical protein GY45DRAFT_1262927 [Cubamyces sp. BRFM 1775]
MLTIRVLQKNIQCCAVRPTIRPHPTSITCSPSHLGRPCDSEGRDLPPFTCAPPRTVAMPDDWYPYSSRVEFELAEFLFKKDQMAQSNVSTLMDLWAADVLRYGGKPPFADNEDLHRAIDATDLGDVSWTVLRISYVGPRPSDNTPQWMNETFELWYRDPRKVALKMLADPSFNGHFDVAAYREFTAKGERRYGNLMSGHWAWRQSDVISAEVPHSEGAMFVPIILGSDKTTVSVATGQNDYYPLYMSLGNLHGSMRRAHRDSVLPIAFLAIPKAERRYADTTAFRRFRRQLFHTSLAAILQSLKPGMHCPEVARCPDGHFRRVIWGLGPYIADYPEQVLVANIVQGWCPACLKFPNGLDAEGSGQRRTRTHTEALRRTFEPAVLWDDYGVVADVVPFTSDFPRADINELLSGDLLHQIIKGTFKDHLVTWVGHYLQQTHGEARAKELLDEIDRRCVPPCHPSRRPSQANCSTSLAATPPFPGLRHFKQGRDFKQWTGDDSKALMKIYLPAISGIVPSSVVCAIASFLEFCYIARRSHLTETTLAQMDAARRDFHRHRVVFIESGVRPDGFSLPRQHSLDHYLQHIRNFGAPNGLCSSITEAKHIKAVKEPWRRSNRYEALGQMLLTNQRLEKLSAARADFTARGMMGGTCLSAAIMEFERNFADASNVNSPTHSDTAEAHGGESDVPEAIVDGPRVSGFVVLARKPQPHYPRTLDALGEYLSIPDLPMLVSCFLHERSHPDDPPLSPYDDGPPCYPIKRVHVFHSATATYYAPSDPSGSGGMHREHIRATPSWRKGPPRYDSVFLGRDPSAQGFRSLHAARVRAFLSLLPCALVEWFSPVGDEPDVDTGLWVVEPDLDVNGRRELGVVHIETVLRSAHLIPVFGEGSIPPYLTAADALDSFRAYYINKYADHHAHEIAF